MTLSPTPRQQVLEMLAGSRSRRVPFYIWDNKLPGGDLTRQLLELGACVIVKSSVMDMRMRDVTAQRRQFTDAAGGVFVSAEYTTPAGPLSTLHRHMPGTVWQQRHIFQGPDDYPALEAYLSSLEFVPNYDRFLADDARLGAQSIARPATLRNPLQEVAYELMGVETFAAEWADNRPRVLRLMELLDAALGRQLAILAASPARYVVVDGNTDVRTIGLERFERYAMPHIARCCSVLHGAGKLVGSHLDGDNRLLAPLIAQTDLDFIESFTPPPGADLSVAEALAAWPNKTLLLNFPSSVHLQGEAKVLETARGILDEARSCGRVALGISEDVPEAARQTIAPLAKCISEYNDQQTEPARPLINNEGVNLAD